MIYRHFTGMPNRVPEDATFLGETTSHFQSGTQYVQFYTDDPDSEEDRKIFESAKAVSKEINARELPIWI